MDKQFQIGQIAHFFNLPASTLRYWESEGILSANKNAENNYRKYTISDLMTLSDVIFYKNLRIPLKQIRDMEKAKPSEHECLLNRKVGELKQQQRQIQHQIEKIHCHLAAIETLKKLQLHPYTKTDIDTECIVSFDLIEIEKLKQYIENPYLYSRIQHSKNLKEERRGLTIPPEQLSCYPESQILWKKSRNSYIAYLLKETIAEGSPNNLEELLFHIQKKYHTGSIISRFLLYAQEDGQLYDFYKAFVEILD